MLYRFALYFLLLISAASCAPQRHRAAAFPSRSITPSAYVSEPEISKILSFLTHDSLNGRAAGTRENQQVTRYLADYFSSLKLQPLLNQSFVNTFYTSENDSAYTISNVIAYLPGKTKPDEFILVSAHFDHVVSGYYNQKDKIYNGANDNASGTTAMMMMAKHYALTGTNERSIIFCGFNGEEMGLLGSLDLANKLPAEKIVAMINLEMLGIPQYGKGTLMVTGMKRSDLVAVLRQNLKGTAIRIVNEKGNLFERSDNYAFALRSVPAHSIMASDDRDRCYHQSCDEWKRIDTRNLTNLVNGILTGISSIVSGADTPTRISLK